jgi:hypothetical protein
VGNAPSQSFARLRQPGRHGGGPQLLSNMASTRTRRGPQIVNHYNVQPVFDVYANVGPAGSGQRGSGGRKDHAEFAEETAARHHLDLRGQVATMETSFYRLGLGLIFAIMLVYFLMAVNFQSWLDPFIILMALPGALAGIVWMLFVTQTTFSVPSLMGSIMCIGVATANSILMVVFANDQRLEGMDARRPRWPRAYPHPARADDRPGDDYRHAAHGARLGRGRRAERAAGTRRDRRPAAGHRYHAVHRADRVQLAEEESARRFRPSGALSGSWR